jgi:hypothetical protein
VKLDFENLIGLELRAQQSIRLQQPAQLPMSVFTQTADAGATCIHASNTLNKMAVNRFTIRLYSSTVKPVQIVFGAALHGWIPVLVQTCQSN